MQTQVRIYLLFRCALSHLKQLTLHQVISIDRITVFSFPCHTCINAFLVVPPFLSALLSLSLCLLVLLRESGPGSRHGSQASHQNDPCAHASHIHIDAAEASHKHRHGRWKGAAQDGLLCFSDRLGESSLSPPSFQARQVTTTIQEFKQVTHTVMEPKQITETIMVPQHVAAAWKVKCMNISVP